MRREIVLVTLGIVATATGRTGLVVTTGVRSQLRRSLNSDRRARMVFERPLGRTILATRIGLEVLPTTPLTRCRKPLVTIGGLLFAATGFALAFAICICGTGWTRALLLGGGTGPDATVRTTPVAV